VDWLRGELVVEQRDSNPLTVQARKAGHDVRDQAGKQAEATARSNCRLRQNAANCFAWALLSSRQI
jgi:hypothetical protein